MSNGLIRLVVAWFVIATAVPVWAQDSALPAAAPPAVAAQTAPSFSQAQLDQLLAPIALYPDALVGQILMASTYPLEVVEAYRWIQEPQNARLKADQLTTALEGKDWDPSVKSLVPFPQVLRMMNDRLDWMPKLGNAFLAQEADVMDSVQRLRQAAEKAGSLKSSSQQVVTTTADQAIAIAPADPEVVYVPVYDPTVVYGVWPYPAYPPYYYWPPGFIYGASYWPGFWWWPPIEIGFYGGYWGWGNVNWHDHNIHIDHDRYDHIAGRHPHSRGDTWQHDSYHRRGVAYRDAGTAARFGHPVSPPGSRQSYRGYGRTPGTLSPRQGTPSTRQSGTHQLPAAGRGSPAGEPSARQLRSQHPAGTSSPRQLGTHQPAGAPSARQLGTRQPMGTSSTRQLGTRQFPNVQRGGSTVQSRTPPAFGGYGSGADIRSQSQRGRSSLQTMPSSPRSFSTPRSFGGASSRSFGGAPSRSGGGRSFGGAPSGGARSFGGGGRGGHR